MVVLIGGSGFVGSEFKKQSPLSVCVDRENVYDSFLSATHIINCVGDIYCKNGLNAIEANVMIPTWLARQSAKLIHISTSVVSDTPYYRMKMCAEDTIRMVSNNYTIYRLPWLYGSDFCKECREHSYLGVEMDIYHESGYPMYLDRAVKYILDNLSNHNNETISLGGECRNRIGWATDMYPDLKWRAAARGYDYHCNKPDIIL